MTDADPKLAERARAMLALDRGSDAESFARQALAQNPDDAELHALLARALLMQQRFAEARAEAGLALRNDPDNLDGLALLSAAASELGDHDVAIDAITRGLVLAPAWDGAHRQRAAVLLDADRADEALAAADRAVELNPTSAGNHAARAAVLIKLRRFEQARLAVSRALELDPQHQQAHRIAGVLAIRTGERDSEARFREALRLDPSDRSSRSGMNVAIKARNPVYRAFLAYSEWVRGATPFVRGAVSIAPFLLVRTGLAVHAQPLSGALIAVGAAFFIISWSLNPVLALTMLASPRDRVFVDARERRSALAFLAFTAGAVTCIVASVAPDQRSLIPTGFGLGLWAFAVGNMTALKPVKQRRLLIGGAVTAAVAIGCAVAGATGRTGAKDTATGLAAFVLLSGIASLWYMLIASRSRRGRSIGRRAR